MNEKKDSTSFKVSLMLLGALLGTLYVHYEDNILGLFKPELTAEQKEKLEQAEFKVFEAEYKMKVAEQFHMYGGTWETQADLANTKGRLASAEKDLWLLKKELGVD